MGAEVVVVDRDGGRFPADAGVAKASDQLFLLRINAENWGVATGAGAAQAVDELELVVAFGGRGGRDALVVHAQGVAQGAQEAGDGARRNRQCEDIREVGGEVAGGGTGPAQVGTGVAGGVMAEQKGEFLTPSLVSATRSQPNHALRSLSDCAAWHRRVDRPSRAAEGTPIRDRCQGSLPRLVQVAGRHAATPSKIRTGRLLNAS